MTDFTSISPGDSGAPRQAAAASSDAASAKRDVAELENELARMKLACAAVWELVKDKTGLTEDDLIARMAILDAKDGIADGRLTRGVRKCASCWPHRPRPAKQMHVLRWHSSKMSSKAFNQIQTIDDLSPPVLRGPWRLRIFVVKFSDSLV
jgi:hypothetical protein